MNFLAIITSNAPVTPQSTTTEITLPNTTPSPTTSTPTKTTITTTTTSCLYFLLINFHYCYLLLYFIFTLVCDLFELNGNPKYISDIQTDPFIFQEYLFPRSSGANFNKLPVTILITLTPELSKKYLEFEFIDKSTNIKDYVLQIYDNSNNLIDVINQTSSLNRDIVLPKVMILESKPISKIEIIILSTTNKNPPIHVKISLKGYLNSICEPTTTTSRTTPPRPTTTTLTSSTTSRTTPPRPTTTTTSSRKNFFLFFSLFYV